ncbi:MAG: indolepyruvate ferredoxin oxidoreductase family protein, partial [Ilumatobacter sp.]|nr:indolepyruvate ferredoxin oxidoreductase family protein [Ilumatobacter sp.]
MTDIPTDISTSIPPVSGYSLDDRYLRTDGTVFLTGIQALARIPIEQLRRDHARGLNTAAFLSGYPGSPLGGFDLEVARAKRVVPDLPIVHQLAVNEELGATAVMGSQLAQGRPDATRDGVVGFWYGKAPGLDRAGDALRHGVFAGSSSNGGAVVLVGDDPACKSSTMPSSSDATLVDLHMPILYPGTMAECLELGLHAVAMSRASGLWSSMKIVTPVADGSGTVQLPVLTDDPVMPTVEIDGKRWVSHPSAKFLGQRMLEVEREFREVRLPLAQRYGVENRINRISVNPSDAWIGLVATGFTYYEMLDALRRLGLDGDDQIRDAGIRILQLRMPVPFDAELVREFSQGLDEILVIEEKNPTLEWLIKDALYNRGHHPHVYGKTHENGDVLMQSWGRLDADAILPGLRRRLEATLGDRLAPLPPVERRPDLIPLTVNRTPFFCSGCPHNWGTKVPEGALVGAGTGCHGMSLLMDEDRVGETIGITAMGNEGAQWIGMAPFVETGHIFQNYGDGTFFHSAQLALQYCIGAGVDITFKILYNGTVAMTGGQDSTSPIAVPELVTILLAHGVTKVAVTAEDPSRYDHVDLPDGVAVHDRDDILDVQRELAATSGVTVLIHDQYCAAELRRGRKRGKLTMPTRRVVINHRVCEGCGDCGDVSNCLSVQPVETPLGRKTMIDQASCNYDESCLKGDCPAFMTVEMDPERRANGRGATAPSTHVPDPEIDHEAGLVRLRLAGIGGTGVVTVAQILSTAAMLDGWNVRGLDQTGLSQKAGPVISDVVLAHGHGSSNLVGDGEADLILGFDAMVAASDNSIAAADPDRTAVVASSAHTPTGRMISHPQIPYPDDSIERRFADAAASTHVVDAASLSERLTGSAMQANVLLLGVAYQLGRVPVAGEAIEQAIELNGVAVAANLAAFDWGRRWAHDPATVESLAAPAQASIHDVVTVPDLPAPLAGLVSEFPDALRELLTMLAADLVGYQDAKYAR